MYSCNVKWIFNCELDLYDCVLGCPSFAAVEGVPNHAGGGTLFPGLQQDNNTRVC